MKAAPHAEVLYEVINPVNQPALPNELDNLSYNFIWSIHPLTDYCAIVQLGFGDRFGAIVHLARHMILSEKSLLRGVRYTQQGFSILAISQAEGRLFLELRLSHHFYWIERSIRLTAWIEGGSWRKILFADCIVGVVTRASPSRMISECWCRNCGSSTLAFFCTHCNILSNRMCIRFSQLTQQQRCLMVVYSKKKNFNHTRIHNNEPRASGIAECTVNKWN